MIPGVGLQAWDSGQHNASTTCLRDRPAKYAVFHSNKQSHDNEMPKVPHDGHAYGTLASPHKVVGISPLGHFGRYLCYAAQTPKK